MIQAWRNHLQTRPVVGAGFGLCRFYNDGVRCSRPEFQGAWPFFDCWVVQLRSCCCTPQQQACTHTGEQSGQGGFQAIRGLWQHLQGVAKFMSGNGVDDDVGGNQIRQLSTVLPAARYVSFSRGISMTRLHGRVRLSSCSTIRRSHASLQAPDEPGNTKIKVELATPASARDCSVDDLISSNDSALNISPKPSISLSSSGLTASGVPSRPVIPVPPVLIMVLTFGSRIQRDITSRISYLSSRTMAFSKRLWPVVSSRSQISFPDTSSASPRVSEMVSTAMLSGMNSGAALLFICVGVLTSRQNDNTSSARSVRL